MKHLFGTDGIRGVANADLTLDVAARLARALALTHRQIYLGMDTRESSPMFAGQIIASALSAGADVYDMGVVGTPGVAYTLASLRSPHPIGIVVTASHNPYQDNGLKVIASGGGKLPVEEERRLEGAMAYSGLEQVKNPGVGQYVSGKSLRTDYSDHLKTICPRASYEGTLILDCANGALSAYASSVFHAHGIKTSITANRPDGRNINAGVGATSIDQTRRKVFRDEARQKDLLIAFDGDGDRLMMALPSGTVIDGDALSYLVLKAELEQGRQGDFGIALTKMSTLGTIRSIRALGVEPVITDVGDRALAEALRDGGFLLGAEQSGHVIFPEEMPTGDGIHTALRFLSLYHSEREIRWALKTYHPSYQELMNFSFRSREDLGNFVESTAYRKFVALFGKEGDSRVFIRPSGTEPVLRVLLDFPSKLEAAEARARIMDFMEAR